MNSRNIIIVIIVLVAVIIGGIWLYNWVLGDTQEASQPISATPIGLATATSGEIAPPTVPTTSDEPPTAIPTEAPSTDSVDTQPAGSASSGGAQVYAISQDESEVRFNIFEELRGAPKDVIGVSNQVAGEVAVDLNDLSTAEVGVIQINARTLVTDADNRNQAIRNRILNTDQYEFVTFTPTQVSGLSGSAAPGGSFTFQVAGDLTIRDTTQPEVFEVTLQVDSQNRLSGTASTVISRANYNLIVPDLPFIADVDDEVTLEIDFVLEAN